MVYLVPVYYELVEYVKVELPEGTDIKIVQEKALEEFRETPLNYSNSEYVSDSEEIDEYATVFIETENGKIPI